MQDKRQYKRYSLDVIEINGKMSLADKVEIIDISVGGVALKADRRLNPGREYMLKLGEKGKSIDVTGVIVRSILSGIEERADGERVTIYTAGMRFKEGSEVKIADFLKSIEHGKKEASPATDDRRLHVRFQITAPGEKILNFPAQFKVKEISLSGIRIQTEQSLRIESMVPMGLTLNNDSTVNFNGRVASCRKMEDTGQAHYDIGVGFLDLTDRDRTLLKTFIDYLVMLEVNAKGEKADI